MKLRKAALTDGDAVLALYREAQAFLAATWPPSSRTQLSPRPTSARKVS